MLEKVKAASQITAAYSDTIIADNIVSFDNSLGSDFGLGQQAFSYDVILEKQGAAVNGQKRQVFPGSYGGELMRFLGQTAQLDAFSAAGFGFSINVVGIHQDKFIGFCCGQAGTYRQQSKQ